MTEQALPKTDDEWRVRLTPAEFRVLRQAGTEAPFTGEYVDTKTKGVYRCRACGAKLFDSVTKFDSDCGWPSFDEAIPGTIRYIEDNSHGMKRVEVRCANCDSHLGHRFDGEHYTAKNARYCINSISLSLEPAA
jgi:peptide-methionine (R)-S-oxide reductase